MIEDTIIDGVSIKIPEIKERMGMFLFTNRRRGGSFNNMIKNSPRKNYSMKSEAEKQYANLAIIDTFLNGLEIAAEENLRENIYDVKQKSFEIRGFLLKLM